MLSLTSQSTSKFRHLQIILFLTTTFLELSLQADVSGYICDDLVVWHDKAVEVAQLASELLKTATFIEKYPALLENTQLFGVQDQNLLVVPFRKFGSMRSGGKKGQDRVVLDVSGNFVGVVFDTNTGNDNPIPAYQKCRPFLLYNHPNLEQYIEDGYQITGFACGSNFLDRNIETNMQAICTTYINLPPEKRGAFIKLQGLRVTLRYNEISFAHISYRNYNSMQLSTAVSYQVEFDGQCKFLNIRPFSSIIKRLEPCLDTWSAIPPPDATKTDSLFDLQSKNYQTSDKFYTCENYTFRITSIRNHLYHIFSLLISNSPSSIQHLTYKQDKLLLWAIPMPERYGTRKIYSLTFTFGFDEVNTFSGIYFVSTKDRASRKMKPCPNFDTLKLRLQARAIG